MISPVFRVISFRMAEIAAVGAALVRSIFKDIAENAKQAIGAAIDELPDGFPEGMTNSICAAMNYRIDLLKTDGYISREVGFAREIQPLSASW